MKILYIIHQFFPEFYTGTERFLLNLASMMQTAGHKVQVITYEHCADSNHADAGGLSTRNYLYHSVPVLAVHFAQDAEAQHLEVDNRKVLGFARDYLFEHREIDLVHLAHPMRLGSFAQAAWEAEKPYLLTLTDFWTICAKVNLRTSSGELCNGPEAGAKCERDCPEIPSAFVRSRLEQAQVMLHRASAVVSPSHFMASKLNEEYPELKIHINPHGVDCKLMRPTSKQYARGDKIVFGYGGSLIEIKGVRLLIKAFNSLKSPNAELRIYGSSFHEEEHFECLKQEAGTNPAIRFCGTYELEDSGKVFGELDCLVVPSIVHENYSMIAHEALACHLPVIAARVGGLPECVIDGRTGYTFDPMRVEDLADKMHMIIEDPTILNGLRETIERKPLPMIEEEAFFYEKLYNSILGSSG